MRSRTVREGSVGLLILAGIGLFAGIALWLKGFSPGNRSFRIFIEFGNIVGLQVGAPVRYRGVNIGKISAINPLPNKVEVEAQINPADIIIPADVVAQVNQSGLISQTAIELKPLSQFSGTTNSKPLDSDCNGDVILCNNARLPGEAGVSIDELIQASVRFANVYTDPKFFANVNSVVQNTSEAAAEITKLSKEFTLLTKDARQELRTFSTSAAAVSRTADKLGVTAEQVNGLLASNRATLVTTLDNLSQTSSQLRRTTQSLGTTLEQVDQGKFIRNLETLTTNAAQTSANLKAASDALSRPENLLMLQQTLDSARATFQNAQKITADLDELTGDPAFRTNLRNLVNGLSGLVSSTQQLQQQAQTAQILAPIASSLKTPAPQMEQIVIPVPRSLGKMGNSGPSEPRQEQPPAAN